MYGEGSGGDDEHYDGLPGWHGRVYGDYEDALAGLLSSDAKLTIYRKKERAHDNYQENLLHDIAQNVEKLYNRIVKEVKKITHPDIAEKILALLGDVDEIYKKYKQELPIDRKTHADIQRTLKTARKQLKKLIEEGAVEHESEPYFNALTPD